MAGEAFDPAAPVGPPEGAIAVRTCTCPSHEGPAALPATSEYFRIKPNRHGNVKVDFYCRRCRAIQKGEARNALRLAAKKIIVSKALSARKGSPHFDDLMDEVYRRIGGYKRLAREIAGFIKDDSPKARVDRRTTAMKLFEATQKRTEAEETNDIKRQATADVKAELRALLKAGGIDLDDLDDLEDAEELDPKQIVDERSDD